MKNIFILVFLASTAFAMPPNGVYKVIRTKPLTETHARFLRNLQLDQNLDFWQGPIENRPAEIMVHPESLRSLEESLKAQGIKYSILIHKLEQIPNRRKRSNAGFDLKDYNSHENINNFIDKLASDNAEWVKTETIGQSYEGRDMKVIKLEKAGPKAPIAWIEAGIHAREWIAPASTLFMINELINNEENKEIIENLNIHVLPMANPDGYEFSRTGGMARFWRKNRAPQNGTKCIGVDLNRNFGFQWGKTGVSHDPCSDIYCGSGPFSEVESLNIKAYLGPLRPFLALGHSVHSYGQLWLWPYGYDYSSRPDNWQEIKQLAEDAVQAIAKVNGTIFDPINSAELCKFIDFKAR